MNGIGNGLVCLGRLVAPLAAVLLVAGAPALAGPLKSLAASERSGHTEVSVKLVGEARGVSTFALDGPKRLVVDLAGVSARAMSAPGSGQVTKVRAAQFDADTARVVLDLSSPAKILDATSEGGTLELRLAAISGKDFKKLVADGRSELALTPASKSVPLADIAKAVAKPAPKAADKAPPVRLASAVSTRPPSRGLTRIGLPVVVIDAGHGGKDVGSISVMDGRYEKDLTLAIAKEIKKELDDSGRVHAILTRSDDRFLPLRQRFEIARRNQAQLFISIHADSAPGSGARGATVYTLSETASDAEAARLAAKENQSDIIAGVDLSAASEVSDILIDLAQRETMNTSAEFAAVLQRELGDDVKLRSRFHRFAGFVVLKAPDVPSVLLETGYVSNREDSKFLFSKEGQRKIAKDVRSAIEAHFLRRLAQR